MKKNYKYLFMMAFLVLPFIFIGSVQADYKAVASNPKGAKCDLYKGSTGYCYYKDTNLNSIVDHVYWLDTGDEVTVLTNYPKVESKNSVCSDYYVYTNYISQNYGSRYGYYCNANLNQIDNTGSGISDELKKEFTDAGFPESYFSRLSVLKKAHPNWVFKAVKTNLEWNDVVNAESAVGKSLIQGDEGYRSTLGGAYDYNSDEFIVQEGSNWYAANSEVVAYYLDPRNFLNDTYVFQFETLESNPSLQTIDGVKSVLKNNFLLQNADDFITAASLYKVSSVYLAALAVQEVGNGTIATSGESFVYSNENNKYKSLRGTTIKGGYYNVYNIGAGTDRVPAQNSVVYAMGGEKGTDTSYERPWTSLSLAIKGGANFIQKTYLDMGQYTIYSKKFNVHPKGNSVYSHQYQTNIKGATSEGNKIFKAYNDLNMLDQAFEFSIPVYNNMPAETKLPNTGNPVTYLKDLKVDGVTVNGFDTLKNDYTVYVGYSKSSVSIEATPTNNKAKVSNTGTKKLNVGNNEISLTVTSENGNTRVYKVNIIRNENETGEITVDEIVEKLGVKSDGTYFSGINLDLEMSTLINKVKSINPNASVNIKNSTSKGNIKTFATGDIISITSANETKEFTIVIYGDTNGDGKIDALDLLRVQKHILNISKLNGAYSKAADPSKNGSIDPLDLLKVQKQVLGISSIEQ